MFAKGLKRECCGCYFWLFWGQFKKEVRKGCRKMGCCLFFGVFGRGLTIGRGVDMFGDLEYLGNEYEKGGDVDVFGGMGCVGGG